MKRKEKGTVHIFPKQNEKISDNYVISIGKAQSNKLVIKNKLGTQFSTINDFHCEIIFDKNIGWYLIEMHSSAQCA